MKWLLGTSMVFVLAVSCFAQMEVPLGGTTPPSSSRKPSRVTTRILTGQVLDKSDAPVSNAVVYLKNEKTLVVKTYIAGDDGSYRFPELSPNIDYEIYAQKDGKKSDSKVLSQFDDRQNARIVLRINTNK